MKTPDELHGITDFRSLVAYLRDELDWEIPEDLPYDRLTYSYTADELGLKLDAQVEITQLRPILGQAQPWGVFFVDFDKAELPVTLLRRILSGVSRKKRASANPGDRALFEKNDLLFVSTFGKADDRRLALAHFHQEPDTSALPTLRVLAWDRHDTPRHMQTVSERLDRLRWPDEGELTEAWKSRWAQAFIDRPREAIRTSKEMATALADCAKQIRGAIQEILPKEKKGQPLTQLFEAVQATLNKDLDEGKFADTYAQTIAYGLLSKRIDQVQRWRAEKARTLNGDLPLPLITADALETAIPTNPFLSELLTSFMSAVGRDAGGSALDFDELGLGDLVDLLNTANMEAVLDDFDKNKQGDDPVIHFYENFFEEYDPDTRFERGVFYTPKAVVSFIVRSVDEVLRTEFGLPLGLADTSTWGEFVATHPETEIPEGAKPSDPFVRILDPATGTGTFPVEAIELIHQRMTEEVWKDKSATEQRRLWNEYVPRHLLPRLYGYELMMAPYAVAHMKIGLKLADTGYDFSGTEMGPDGKLRPMRARVFLANALEPARRFALDLNWSLALSHEAEAGNAAKEERFTVVIGNPPYKGKSANPSRIKNKLTPIGKLLQRYFQVDGEPLGEKNPKWVNNDYVKFLRFSEDLIGASGAGVLGVITSNSWLDGPTFRGVRAALIESFEKLWIIDLHGNINKRERAPDGGPDEGVFEILEGTNVTIGAHSVSLARDVRHVDVFGVWPDEPPSRGKRLWVETRSLKDAGSLTIQPAPPMRFLVAESQRGGTEYTSFPNLRQVFTYTNVGIVSKRDSLTFASSPQAMLKRVEDFIATPPSEVHERFGLPDDVRDWTVTGARADLLNQPVSSTLVRRCQYRPFETRYFYFTGRNKGFMGWPVKPMTEAMNAGPNVLLGFSRGVEVQGPWRHVFCFADMIQHHSVTVKEVNYGAPLWRQSNISAGGADTNLSPAFTARLAKVTGLRFDDGSHAPAQATLPGTEPPPPPQGSLALRRDRGDLKTTFGARDVFDWVYVVLHSPTYRARYADFLKSDFPRVPLPKDRDLFAALVPFGTKLVALHMLDADALPDLLPDPKVRFVSNGGEPRLGRVGADKEVRRDAAGRVYLNEQNWFATVPQSAWEHWIGGYQPAQKWLKDRAQTGSKDKLKPGRLLTEEDILHYRRVIVALEETGKVMAEIDKVIVDHGGWPDAFRGMTDAPSANGETY